MDNLLRVVREALLPRVPRTAAGERGQTRDVGGGLGRVAGPLQLGAPVGTLPAPAQQNPALIPQKADSPATAAATITCPITGDEIPSCCCPVKK